MTTAWGAARGARNGRAGDIDRPAVVCVTPFVWEGGSGVGKPTVYYALRGFQRAGYEVHVVTATNQAGAVTDDVDGLHVHYFRPPLDPAGFDYDARRSFLSLVRSEPRAVVRHLQFRTWWTQFVVLGARTALGVARLHAPSFVYGVNNPGIPPAWWVGRRLGVPVFGRIMGSEIAQVAGVDLDSGRPGAHLRPTAAAALRLGLVRFDELLAFRLPLDALIVTDDGQIGPRTVTDWLGVPTDRLWLWRNGVDRDRFAAAPPRDDARAELGIASDRPVVLWVSQLIDWKQPAWLMDAVPGVLARCPDALFVVVGDGAQRAALEAHAAALGVAASVRFEGFVPLGRVPLFYRAADVFTALYRRANVSNTLLEAMVAGCAVVTLDNGRTREVVRHEDTGLLVEPDRPDLVAPALARLLGDGALRARLGASAEAWAARNLPTWDERIARELTAIEALVAARTARSLPR